MARRFTLHPLWFGLLVFLPYGLAGEPAPPPVEIKVASYNLENFLGEDARTENAPAAARRAAPKSEKAIAAVVRIVAEIAPDILGVCEMGSPEEFVLFQQKLREAGLSYQASEYVQGADPDRHLGLLSRFPIIERHSAADVPFDLNGLRRKMGRGILDVTVRVTEGYDLRLVGVHLKSKLPIPEGEALVRRYEAGLVRKHLEEILAADPAANLLLYGDFNDTRNEAPILEIAGPRGSPTRMNELTTKDDVGDRWTHYWRTADAYTRIDYFFASAGLLHEIVPAKTGIYRSPYWNDASDHRAIYTTIKPVNKSR